MYGFRQIQTKTKIFSNSNVNQECALDLNTMMCGNYTRFAAYMSMIHNQSLDAISIISKIVSVCPEFVSPFFMVKQKVFIYNVESGGLCKKYHVSSFTRYLLNYVNKLHHLFTRDEIIFIYQSPETIYKRMCEMYLDTGTLNNIECDQYRNIMVMSNGIGTPGIAVDWKTCKFLLAAPRNAYCTRYTGWCYNEHLAQQYRDELNSYLQQLFVDNAKLKIFLSYVYSVLVGRPCHHKYFLILTDDRDGDTGKSSLMKFLRQFFGTQYCIDGDQFVVMSTTITATTLNKAKRQLIGKHLLLVDNATSNKRLNVDFVKKLSDNDHIIPLQKSKRHKNNQNTNVHVGLIIACHNGRFFNFDGNDDAFVKRMLVLKLTSKYGEIEDATKHLYKRCDISTNFPKWNSAFTDLMLEIGADANNIINRVAYDGDLVRWRYELWPVSSITRALTTNESQQIIVTFAKWFYEHLEMCTDEAQWVGLQELKQLLRKTPLNIHLPHSEYYSKMKSWLNELGVDVFNRKWRTDGRTCMKRNVLKNYRLKKIKV